MLKPQKAEQVRPGWASPFQVPQRGALEFLSHWVRAPSGGRRSHRFKERPDREEGRPELALQAVRKARTSPKPQRFPSLHTPAATAANLTLQRKQDCAFYTSISILKMDFVLFWQSRIGECGNVCFGMFPVTHAASKAHFCFPETMALTLWQGGLEAHMLWESSLFYLLMWALRSQTGSLCFEGSALIKSCPLLQVLLVVSKQERLF